MFSTKLKTTADVLSVFTKTIEQLNEVAEAQKAEITKQQAVKNAAIAQANAAQVLADAARTESERAVATAEKLKAFLA